MIKCLIFLALTLMFSSCNGQEKKDSYKDNPTSGQSKVIKNHFFKELPEEYFFVQCGLQDKSGQIWFGTAGNGVYGYNGNSFFNFTHQSFTHFSLKTDLNQSDILCCMEDKSGQIWFGTRRGVIRYTPSSGKIEPKNFSLFLLPEHTIKGSSRTRLPYTFQTGDNLVWKIIQDKSGKIWFGTSKGIYTHHPSTDYDNSGPLFRRFLDEENIINTQKLQLNDITGMLQDKNDNIWFVSGWIKREGIVCYDGKSLVNFKPDSIDFFRSIIQRQNGDLLFLNTFKGIYSYNGTTFSNFSKQIGVQKDTIIALIEDRHQNLWFGHNGLNLKNSGDGHLYQYDGKVLKRFTTRDGLSHNHVMCILEDKNGNLWFGTRNTGLCCYDGKTFLDYTD